MNDIKNNFKKKGKKPKKKCFRCLQSFRSEAKVENFGTQYR